MGFVLIKGMYYYSMYLICMLSDEIPSAIKAYVRWGNPLDVDSVIFHPESVPPFDQGLALLRLKTELEYNEDVAPICLSHTPRSNSSLCFTTGYHVSGRYLKIVDMMNE